MSDGLPEYIEQHVERGLIDLAASFWGKPRIGSLLASLLDDVQSLEDDFFELLTERTLENADLVRLKVLGKIIGQPRLRFTEEEYRLLLQARGLANVSRGRASDVFAVLELLIGPGEYTLVEIGDATLLLSALQPISDAELAMLEQILPDVRAAGVGFQLLFSDDPDTFQWGDTWGSPETWGTVRVL